MLAPLEAVATATTLDNPAFTVAIALGAGVIGQALAHHIRMPGIVVFLTAGVLLGPDVANIVRPATLGDGLAALVGLAVAVILFEGGLNLNVAELRRQAMTIRRLVTVGALITAVGGAAAVHFLMGWELQRAVIFGTLVIVTGPTVVTPLVRRIRVVPRLQTILEGEAVLIDPIGAIVAVVTLEVLLSGTAEGAALGLLGIPSRLLVGTLLGVAGGFLIGWLLGRGHIIPDNIHNVFTLALVLSFYAASEAILPESGILAAPVAGLVVGNMRTRARDELKEFKEELTIMLVALLFVLLAADVRLVEVWALGWPAAATIGVLMFVVRPLNVAFCTARSTLTLKEKAFIAWIGPRGIVAAAVASLFAQELQGSGPAARELVALVFLVIAVTVVVQGLTGATLASRLGLRRRRNVGYAIIGANPLGRTMAGALQEAGHEVVLIDSNAQETAAAKGAGFNVLWGNANDERILLRADVEGRRGVIATTPNEGANVLAANRAREVSRHAQTFVCVARGKAGVQLDRLREANHAVLFGRPIQVEMWIHALRTNGAGVSRWRVTQAGEERAAEALLPANQAEAQLLPLVATRKRATVPVDDRTRLREGDEVLFASLTEQAEEVRQRLEGVGWRRVDAAPPASAQAADSA